MTKRPLRAKLYATTQISRQTMTINKELLDFARTRAAWQQDCLRRICTQSELTTNDAQEVFSNLKATEGLGQPAHLEHLNASHLASRTSSTHPETILTSVSEVRNANRLAPGQVLLFAEAGITLVYGYNGSGKTGYARILKQVCRSRQEKQDPILGNVYAARSGGPASAKIAYKSAGTTHNASWRDGSAAPYELSRISVFDATTVPLYADQQNKIEFLPLGLDVLPRLGKACEELSMLVAAEIRAIQGKVATPLPSVTSPTFVQLSQGLVEGAPKPLVPTEGENKRKLVWSAQDDADLLALEEEMRKLSEPAKLSAQYQRLIRAMESVKSKIGVPLGALMPEEITAACKKFALAKSTRQAATIAAAGQFSGDPLGNAPTTEAWRRLFETAESFNAVAYPGEEFPATGKDRVCLLCQQPLSETASDRLKRFKRFLQDTSQADAVRAEEELEATLKKVNAIIVPGASDLDQQLEELADVKPTTAPLRDELKEHCAAMTALKTELARCLKGEIAVDQLPPTTQSPIADIDTAILGLTTDLRAFEDQTKDNSALRDLKAKHSEMLDRKSCADNLTIFLRRREDLSSLERWKNCKNQCETAAISRKNTSLRETYLTEDFRNRITAEVKNLGLDYLPLKVEGRTDHGIGYIGVALSKTGREPTSRILSEGEFRGLALACFFAEIGSIEGHDGIVVDDPVSSLDHLHVSQVASRLVQEVKSRPQVIVFTHDLAFYYELVVSAAKEQVPVLKNWVHTDAKDEFGKVSTNDDPWQAKQVRDRLKFLEASLKTLPEPTSCTPKEYLEKTEALYSKLRETWERLVEECLLNGVVGRFQPGVATLSLRGVEVTGEDHAKIFFAMKKASEHSGHDRPVGRQPTVRTKDDLQRDLTELSGYERSSRNAGYPSKQAVARWRIRHPRQLPLPSVVPRPAQYRPPHRLDLASTCQPPCLKPSPQPAENTRQILF